MCMHTVQYKHDSWYSWYEHNLAISQEYKIRMSQIYIATCIKYKYETLQ